MNCRKNAIPVFKLVILILFMTCIQCDSANKNIRLLTHKEKKFRAKAARKLGELGDTLAVRPLITAMNEEEYKDIRQCMVEALGKIGDPRAIEPLFLFYGVGRDSLTAKTTIEAIQNIGDPAVDFVLKKLNDTDEWDRRTAAKLLGALNSKKAVQPLITALNDQSNRVREMAVRALGTIGDPQAVKPLISALRDKEHDVRSIAAEALGMIGDPQAVEPLISALKDQDEWVRGSAVEALGRISEPGALEDIFKLYLKEGSSWVHTRITAALDEMGDTAVVFLTTKLGNRDRNIRIHAVSLLGDIGDSLVVEPLISVLKDSDGLIRQTTAKALGKIGDPRAVQPLFYAYKNEEDMYFHMAAEEALGKIDKPSFIFLSRALQHEDWKHRETAADILCEIRDPLTLEPLIAILKDPHDSVRQKAAIALGNLGDSDAVEALAAALKDKKQAVRMASAEALSRIKAQEAYAILYSALANKNLEIVAGAYRLFIDSRSIETQSTLIKALHEYGSLRMASDFLNSGNAQFEAAARKWADNHGYFVNEW